MQREAFAILTLVCCWSAAPTLASQSVPVEFNPSIQSQINLNLGKDWNNCFASGDDARQRLQRLLDTQRAITVAEFLGGTIERIIIYEFDQRNLSKREGAEAVLNWLDSVMLNGGTHPSHEPALWRAFSEHVPVAIRGEIHYDIDSHCRSAAFDIGLDENHFVVRDYFGVFWWYVWDNFSPPKNTTRS